MTDITIDPKYAAFIEMTSMHANEGLGSGLDPYLVAQAMMMAVLDILLKTKGTEFTRSQLIRMAERVETFPRD